MRQLLSSPEGLVGIPDHAGPPQLAHPVDDRRRLRAHEREIPTVQHDVGCPALDVGDDRVEGRQAAVDVGDDRDSHPV